MWIRYRFVVFVPTKMHSDTICGLDIGASSTRALILEPTEKILGFAECHTKGFSKGVVSNLSLLSDTIEEAVSKAETLARRKVRKLIVGLSGMHIRTSKSRGSVHISDMPSEITESSVKRCIESARLIAMSLDREVVHLVPERFYIDDKMEISDPLGLFGSKLDVDLNIITTFVSILQNVTKAINLAGYEVEDMVLSGAGTGLAIFEPNQLQEGAVVIDVGKDITEATLFVDGKLKECFYFPFGSDDLTQVLQDRLKIMFEKAEEMKIKYGIITKDDFDISDVAVRRDVSNILAPKVEEIMQDVYKKIEPFLKQRKQAPHICVVGGVSKMDGFIECIEQIFSLPVEMGRIQNSTVNDISFASCLGLAKHWTHKRAEKKSRFGTNTNSFAGRIVSRIQNIVSEYF